MLDFKPISEPYALKRGDIAENVMAIKVSRSYREGITGEELYDITRGYWKIDRKRADRVEYVFSVCGGVVKEVYRIKEWLPAGTVPRPTLPDAEVPEGRYEFVGEIAEEAIRNKYVGKSIANLYQKGEANPVRYFYRSE